MPRPLTYTEALARIAELEAHEATFNERVEKAADAAWARTESAGLNEARSENNALEERFTRLRERYNHMVEALRPILGMRTVDEPMVVHEARNAVNDLLDDL